MGKRVCAIQALILTLVLLSNFISGCKPPLLSSKEQAFADIVPVPYHELNNILRLKTPPGVNDHKFGNPIELELLNGSQHPISLPSDHGIKLYTYEEITDEWVEIENLAVYLPIGNSELLPASNEGPGGPVTAIFPDIQDFSKPIKKVNPSAVLISGIMMLRWLKEEAAAARIEKAMFAVLDERKHVTYDVGGTAKTDEYAQAIVDKMHARA